MSTFDSDKEWALDKAKDEEGFDITAGYQKIDTIIAQADFLATYPWGNLTEAQAMLIAEGACLIKAIAADVASHVKALVSEVSELTKRLDAEEPQTKGEAMSDAVPEESRLAMIARRYQAKNIDAFLEAQRSFKAECEALVSEIANVKRTRDELLCDYDGFQLEVRAALGCPDDGVPFVEHIKRMREELAAIKRDIPSLH